MNCGNTIATLTSKVMTYISNHTADIAIKDSIRAKLAADAEAWLAAKQNGGKAQASLPDPEPAKPRSYEKLAMRKPEPRDPSNPGVSEETARINRLRRSGMLGIRTRLRAAGATQTELAKRLGLSPQLMSQYLSGETSTTEEMAERIRTEAEAMISAPVEKPKIQRGVEWPSRSNMVALMRRHGVKAIHVKHKTGFPGSYVQDCIAGRYNPSSERLPIIERAILDLVQCAIDGREPEKKHDVKLYDIGVRLRRMLDDAGLIQKDLREAMCVSSGYISNILAGRQEVSQERVEEIEKTIKRLARK
jgi:transcriptional regulator with XRE-family HTH domain